MKKIAKKKRARRATSGVAPIRFDTSDRKRLGWLQDDLGGLTLAGAVKWAVKDAYDRRKSLQKVGRMSQELRGTMPQTVPFTPGGAIPGFTAGQLGQPADALQSDIRLRVVNANNRPACIHDPLGEFAFCEICDAIKLAESKEAK